MDTIALPSDLEQFAIEAVSSGRYQDRNEVLAAGLELLRNKERLRTELRTSVFAAIAQGEAEGFLTLDDVMARADAVIEEMAGSAR